MHKKEEFKNFVSLNPNLIDVVKSKNKTWQELYEIYDLYGDNKEVWDKYLNMGNNIDSINELTKLLKNVNLDSVQKYIDTARKIVGVIGELNQTTTKLGPTTKLPINKIFED